MAEERNTPVENIYIQEKINLRDEQNAAAQVLETEPTHSVPVPCIQDLRSQSAIEVTQEISTALTPTNEQIQSEIVQDKEESNQNQEIIFGFVIDNMKNQGRVFELILFLESEGIVPFNLSWRSDHENCYIQYRVKPEANITEDSVASILRNSQFAKDTARH